MALPIPIIDGILGVAGKVIERVWPDPAAQADAARKLVELKQQGELAFLNADLQLLAGQLEINKMEAMHGGNFKGGWRPFIGWCCGIAFAYKFILQPFLVFGVQVVAHFTGSQPFPVDMLPELAWSEMSVPLMGLLGLGALRTYEKKTT